MPSMRFSIVGLMVLVAVIALGIATLRQASEFAASLTLTASVVILCWAVLGAFCCDGRQGRVFWGGFALFGWVYLYLVLIPGLREAVGNRLASQMLLPRLQELFSKPLSTAPTTRAQGVALVWARRDNSVWVNGMEVDLSHDDAIEQTLSGIRIVEIWYDPGAGALMEEITQVAQKMKMVVSTRPAWAVQSEGFQNTFHPIFALRQFPDCKHTSTRLFAREQFLKELVKILASHKASSPDIDNSQPTASSLADRPLGETGYSLEQRQRVDVIDRNGC